MTSRLISIAVLVPIVIWANLIATPVVFQVLVFFAIGLALREYLMLALPSRDQGPVLGLGLIWSALLLFIKTGSWVLGASVALSLLLIVLFLLKSDDPSGRWSHLMIAFFGIHYIGTLLAHVGMLRALPHGAGWVFFLLFATWFADSAAYVVGHWIGRHKLAAVLSPGKTVEGLLGGIIGSLAAIPLCRYWIFPDLPPVAGTVLAIVIAVVGPLGDLSESLVKRALHVKDSGTLIPGHGGALDRVDALLFNAPLVYYSVLTFG